MDRISGNPRWSVSGISETETLEKGDSGKWMW